VQSSKYLLAQIVPSSAKGRLELAVATPFPHVDYVLDDQPDATERLGKANNLKRGVFAQFTPELIGLLPGYDLVHSGEARIKVNRAHRFTKCVNVKVLQAARGQILPRGSFASVDFARQRPKVERGDDFNPGRPRRAQLLPPAPQKQIEGPDSDLVG